MASEGEAITRDEPVAPLVRTKPGPLCRPFGELSVESLRQDILRRRGLGIAADDSNFAAGRRVCDYVTGSTSRGAAGLHGKESWPPSRSMEHPLRPGHRSQRGPCGPYPPAVEDEGPSRALKIITSRSEEEADDEEGLYPLRPRRRAGWRTVLGVHGGVGEQAEDLSRRGSSGPSFIVDEGPSRARTAISPLLEEQADADDEEAPLYSLPLRRRQGWRTVLCFLGGVGERAEDLEPPRYRAECLEPDLGMRRIPGDGLYDATLARTLRRLCEDTSLSGLEEAEAGRLEDTRRRIRHAPPKSKDPCSGRTWICGSKKSEVVGSLRLLTDAVGGLSIGHAREAPAATSLQAAPPPDLEIDPESLLPTRPVPSPDAAGNSGSSSPPPGAAANPGSSSPPPGAAANPGGSSPPAAAANLGGSGGADQALAAGGGGDPADPGDALAPCPPPNERYFNWEIGHLNIAALFVATLYATLDSETKEWITLKYQKCADGYTYTLLICCGLVGFGVMASTSVISVRVLRDIASVGSRLSSVVATFLMIVAMSKPVGYHKGLIFGAIVSTIMIILWVWGSRNARKGLKKFWNLLKSFSASIKAGALSAWSHGGA